MGFQILVAEVLFQTRAKHEGPKATTVTRMGRPDPMRGFPKIRGTIFGDPNYKVYSIWGSILGSPILGNYHGCWHF